ncbi:transposase [Victivallis sp. Marseille-Q1083]|uniref:transposase n=1 Tax=Victivallis sp. Marseille-Q1083 TaxID=2717288 RepID=UPI0026DC061F|nr:transposase [Victivallis sp. Marseille-Q1083]
MNCSRAKRQNLDFGRDRPLTTPSPLYRFENGMGRQACLELSRLFVEFFIKSFLVPPRELVLDFDATDDLTLRDAGNMITIVFLPLYVFCGDPLLTACLRPSKTGRNSL